MSSWLIRIGLLPHLVAFLHIRMFFEERVIENQSVQLSWAPRPFRAVPYGIRSSRSEQVKARKGALKGLLLMKKDKFSGHVKVKVMVEFKILREVCKANSKINPYLSNAEK